MIECMRTEATRKTVTEQRWIPVKYHELTEEERKECLFSADIKYMLDCELPDDEQEIIVTDGRHVWVDTCIVNDGYALDSEHDWIEDVVAWMPLPEPYRDHLYCLRNYEYTEEFTGIDVHDISNLMPSCGSCNRYKSTMDLENFRKQLQKIPDRLKRDVCTYNIALRYGMVQENREPIKFYFEKVGGVDGN